jgi:hypothetical protein
MKRFAVQLGDGVVIGAVIRVAPGLPGLDPEASARAPRPRSVLEVVAEREIESLPTTRRAIRHTPVRFGRLPQCVRHLLESRGDRGSEGRCFPARRTAELGSITSIRVGGQARKGFSLVPSVGPQRVALALVGNRDGSRRWFLLEGYHDRGFDLRKIVGTWVR